MSMQRMRGRNKMILERKERIELPSWEEFEVELEKLFEEDKCLCIYNKKDLVGEFYYNTGLTFGFVWYIEDYDYKNLHFDFTKQGYQQAIAKICELGGFCEIQD